MTFEERFFANRSNRQKSCCGDVTSMLVSATSAAALRRGSVRIELIERRFCWVGRCELGSAVCM